jgi:hypothetical protein
MHHGRTGVAALLDAAAAKHNEGEYAGALAAFAEVGLSLSFAAYTLW